MDSGEGLGKLKSVTSWAQVQRDLLRLERDEEKAQIADTIAQLPPQVINSHRMAFVMMICCPWQHEVNIAVFHLPDGLVSL